MLYLISQIYLEFFTLINQQLVEQFYLRMSFLNL